MRAAWVVLLLAGCAQAPVRTAPEGAWAANAAPALRLPFQLRGHPGTVVVRYGENRDPVAVGFDALHLPFDVQTTVGFPVFDASIEYEGTGYRAFLGWIQLVTVRDTKTGEESTTVDELPFWREKGDVPFFAFGSAPTTFDAPGPNPPRTDEQWEATTFLVGTPDVGRTRRLAPIIAVRWGYTLVAGRATPVPVRAVPVAEWERLVGVLRARYPDWEFLPSVTAL